MYRSFDALAVQNERELRDPARLKKLNRNRNLGMLIAAIICAVAGVGLTALGFAGIYILLAVKSAPSQTGWTIVGVGFFFGIMCIGMAIAFFKEAAYNAVSGCLKDPQNYDFVKGRIVKATFLSDGEHSSEKMMIEGRYGENGLFIEEFDPDIWSDAVAERGEAEGLKPGDDRYDQKGKRVRLPIEVWVVHKIGARGPAALAGIPAETVELLNAARRRK